MKKIYALLKFCLLVFILHGISCQNNSTHTQKTDSNLPQNDPKHITQSPILTQKKPKQKNMQVNNFQSLTFKNTKGESLPYQMLLPLNPNDTQKYPLILFLHGVLHRGTDNKIQTEDIEPLFLNPATQKQYPCFLIAPQCPKTSHWARFKRQNDLVVLENPPTIPVQLVFELIDEICSQYPIDTKRIYITGLSMGAFGTFDMLLRKPQMFAAAIPICGGGPSKEAAQIKHIPIWIFHGANDDIVSVTYSREMAAELKKVGANYIYTEYPDVKHNSWINAYSNPDLLSWLFLQKLP